MDKIKKNKDLLYIFQKGRLDKYKNQDFSHEFFYAFDKLDSLQLANLYEINQPNETILVKLFIKPFYKLLVKLTKLNIDIVNSRDEILFEKIRNNKKIVATSSRLGLIIVFWTLVKRIKNKEIIVINSGLFNNPELRLIQKICRELYLRIFFNKVSKIVFTSKTEYEFAIDNRPKYKSKYELLEFSVDVKFWKNENESNFKEKEKILFIGNNGLRDFKKLIEIAKNLPKIEFIFISSVDEILNCNLKNIEVIKGDWGESILTDKQIREYYTKARLTILPIVDTLVASGTSVGLQSMAAGTPVLISKFKGFWNYELFEDKSNIFFCDSDSIQYWCKLINEIYEDDVLLKKISINALETIKQHYDKDIFDQKFRKLIDV